VQAAWATHLQRLSHTHLHCRFEDQHLLGKPALVLHQAGNDRHVRQIATSEHDEHRLGTQKPLPGQAPAWPCVVWACGMYRHTGEQRPLGWPAFTDLDGRPHPVLHGVGRVVGRPASSSSRLGPSASRRHGGRHLPCCSPRHSPRAWRWGRCCRACRRPSQLVCLPVGAVLAQPRRVPGPLLAPEVWGCRQVRATQLHSTCAEGKPTHKQALVRTLIRPALPAAG
jgi:hypothetical protein